MSDASSGTSDAYYRFTFAIGPQISQDAWIGMEWAPVFDPSSGPPQNPILLRAITTGTTLAYKPVIYYDVGAAEFVLELRNGLDTDGGTDTRVYTAPCTQLFTQNQPVRIVVGWSYNPDTVYIMVTDRQGNQIASVQEEVTTLPALVSFDGQLEFFDFKGLFTAHIIKLENYASGASFMANPTYYVNPDPVIPDAQGNIPSTSLDNAVYAAAWTAQQNGTGGAHDSHFDDKEWTPIWRDYVTAKGMMFFPSALPMKYLKLEFTNLNEEPYPIYESGISTTYAVFPTSVTQTATVGPQLYTGEGGFLGLGTFISLNGVTNVNWLSPQSVSNAVQSVLSPQVPPVVINQGSPIVTSSIPNQGTSSITDTYQVEMGSSYVYQRDALNPYILAQDQYNTTIKAEGLQQLAQYTDVPWDEIMAQNPGAITKTSSVGAIPLRGTDYWVFPGQQLKISAPVMAGLTNTSTVTERQLTLEHRVRFNTTSIHRYDTRTLTRDAAVAYFAGVREVQPYISTFIANNDPDQFVFSMYDPTQWVATNTVQLPSGPTSAAGEIYRISNSSFDVSLVNWIAEPDDGSWSQTSAAGHWALGSATILGDERAADLLSTKISVVAGDVIDFSCWVKWDSLVVTAGEAGMVLGAVTYLGDDVEIDRPIFAQISYPDWTVNPNSTDLVGIDNSGFTNLTGTWTVPDGVDTIRVLLGVTDQVFSGQVWFDLVEIDDGSFVSATLFKDITTQSTFAKVTVDFLDSGLIRSDSMWADIVPDSQSISDTALAYYVDTIPDVIPSGFWADTIQDWGSTSTAWGDPFSVVSITVDGNRVYQGNRVIHFYRAPLYGEAGLMVRQFTNWIPLGLFRIGCVVYKPYANDNQIRLRLRRISDGVMVHEETLTAPVGRWFEYQSAFVEIPDTEDQEYQLEITLVGDDEDELYLSDVYCEIARIRYFMRLGGEGATLFEVTDLRYVDGYAQVTATTPVNEMSVQAAIMSPAAWAYGCTITPNYLK